MGHHCMRVMQGHVQTPVVHQMIVSTFFFDHTLVQNHDAVNPPQCGDTVRYKDDRLVWKSLYQIREHSPL